MAESDIEQAIKQSAQGPAKASGDSGSVEQHGLAEQIEADRYLESKKASRGKGAEGEVRATGAAGYGVMMLKHLVSSWFGNGGKASAAPSRPPVRFVRAKFDSAQTTTDNRRHWANADGLSPNAALSSEVRRTLRNRARYEVANNSYAKGIVRTLANDTIGTGPRLQMLTTDTRANDIIERAFEQWSKAINLPEKLRTMRLARAESGEVFGILTSNPAVEAPVQLDLRLVEPDQVTSPPGRLLRIGEADGITFDSYGNPIAYTVLRRHPGDGGMFGFSGEFDTVPAASVVHYYRVDRPGQWRGIPDITPALPLFAQLRRYTLAVIAAAETAADFAAVIYTDAPPNGESRQLRNATSITGRSVGSAA